MKTFHFRPAIVLFGDSITQYGFGYENTKVGWASLLASAYQRHADVLNRGFSGYNSRHALEMLPRVWGNKGSDDFNILFGTLWFGANDASLPGECQHVPLEEYQKNVVKIIRGIRQETNELGDFPIVVMTPPPLDAEAWKREINGEHYDRTNESARKYGLAAKQSALAEKCLVLDIWEILEGDKGAETFGKYLCDGLHLSESGNEMVYQGLMDMLRKESPSVAPQLKQADGTYQGPGVPMEEKLWTDLV